MAGNGVFAEIIDGDVFKYYCEGEWKKSSSGKSVAIINPSTRKTQYKVQGIFFRIKEKKFKKKIYYYFFVWGGWKYQVWYFFLLIFSYMFLGLKDSFDVTDKVISMWPEIVQ